LRKSQETSTFFTFQLSLVKANDMTHIYSGSKWLVLVVFWEKAKKEILKNGVDFRSSFVGLCAGSLFKKKQKVLEKR
jgi:hypothetical protein